MNAAPDDPIPSVGGVPPIVPHDRPEEEERRRKKKRERKKDSREVSEREYNAACVEVYDSDERKRRICGETHIIDRES